MKIFLIKNQSRIPMSKVKIITCAIVVFLLSGTYLSAQKKCMFIGAAPGKENAEYDKHLIPQLEAWGYIIDKKHYSTDLASFTAEDYAPYDFIFLSESVHSSEMSPLKDIPKPMLCSDGWGAKESALAFGSDTSIGILEPAQPVVFLDGAANHSLAAGYTPGTVVELGTVTDRKDPCLIVWGKPSIPVISIAGVDLILPN